EKPDQVRKMAMRKLSGNGSYFGRIACCMTASFFASSGICAEATESPNDKWPCEITPDVFAAGVKATTGVGGITADIDLSFNDIVNHLDFYGAALFEARHGRWTFGLDSFYVRMNEEKAASRSLPVGLVRANADLSLQ